MPKPCFALLTLAVLSYSVVHAQATTLRSEAFGYAKVSIVGGTGGTKRASFFSAPLLSDAVVQGRVTGTITGANGTTVTSAGAGWTVSQLAQTTAPVVLEVVGGPEESTAIGRTFLVTANTSDTATLSLLSGDTFEVSNLIGHQYRLRAADTLLSIFGTPSSSGITGATNPNDADTVVVIEGGTVTRTYYYNTNLERWARVGLGGTSSDFSHVPILPDVGVVFTRNSDVGLEFLVTGTLPEGARRLPVRNAGTTLLPQSWPVTRTLAEFGLQDLGNWVKNSDPELADAVVLRGSDFVPRTFFHDGTDWRELRLGRPISNNFVIPVGSAVQINKRGSATGYTALAQAAPYSLD